VAGLGRVAVLALGGYSLGAGGVRSRSAADVRPARGLSAAAQDCQVVNGLVTVENMVVADTARATRKVRSLAHRVEVRDDQESALCARIIHDAAAVNGRADTASIRRTTAASVSWRLTAASLASQQEITTADMTKLQAKAATRSQDIEMLASLTASMDATLDAIMSNIG
jgi:hypothetical protein